MTRTKVLVPRRRDELLSRPRLLDLLRSLLDDRLILITAQAGYGKTSLLVDFVQRVELPVCWLTLDELDRDLHRFLVHFIAALAQRFAGLGSQSLAILQNGASDTPDVSRLVTTMVNEVYEQVGQPFLLVLDDYHLVDGSPQVGRFVSQFIRSVDENCHVVIASRALLTLPDLPLMVARSLVAGLDHTELAFRPDEIQAFVLQNYRVTISDALAEELAVETEGWIAGLLLSTQSMWQGMPDRVRTARASGVGLYDFLAQQVLDQQPASVRRFLLRTSLFGEFDADLCESVLGPTTGEEGRDWQNLIEAVLRHNLFVLPVGDDGSYVRYHHLFRDFLQARLALERPDEEQAILRQLADVYRKRKEWDRAHALYSCLGDIVAVADLIEEAGTSLTAGGRYGTLDEWLRGVPAEVFETRPGLLSLLATVAMVRGETEHALSLLNRAAAACEAAQDLPRLARTLLRRAVAYRLMGDYQPALMDVETVLQLTSQDERLSAVKAEALRTKGASLIRMGQWKTAIDCLSQSLTAYEALGEVDNVSILLTDLGVAYENTGRYNRALDHYQRALEFWRQTNNLALQAYLLNNLGVLHHLRGDYERAGASLEEALSLARRTGYSRVEALSLASIGDLYSDLDAPTAAQAAFRLAEETAQRIQDRFILFYLDVAQASVARMRGEIDCAVELLDSARRRAQQGTSTFETGLHALEAGRLALASGHATQAITHLEEACCHFDKGGQRVEGARARLFLAVASYDAGLLTLTRDHLGHAFSLASSLDSQHPLVVAGREARAVLEAMQGEPQLRRQASQLLEQVIRFEQRIPDFRRRLRAQVSVVPFAPPKLTIRALGRPQVLVDGKPITSAEWAVQTARDLFFYLLSHPDGATKDIIGTVLWPEDSPAQVNANFKKTIARLRRALGPEAVVFDEDRYWFNRELDYEYDVETFLRHIVQARATANSGNRATAYAAASRLYKGAYLPEITGDWVLPERERLWQAYVEALLQLARLELEAGNPRETLDYCQLALAEEPCLEEAHQLSMRAHALMGNRAAVVRQYERCRQALQEHLHVTPSPQTNSLYATLIHHL